MDTLVRIKAEELNNTFLDFIKKTFKGKRIAVHVYEDDGIDETEYLLNNPALKKRLLKAVENVRNDRNLKEYTIDEINNYVQEDDK